MEGTYLPLGDNYGVPTLHQVSEGAYLLVGDNHGVLGWHQVIGGCMIEYIYISVISVNKLIMHATILFFLYNLI